MDWDQVAGKWKQYQGQAKQKWGKLTDDDLDVIDGKRQELVGRIQERYGVAKDAAEKQADEFVSSLTASDREDQAEHQKSAPSQSPIKNRHNDLEITTERDAPTSGASRSQNKKKGAPMGGTGTAQTNETTASRTELIAALNEDLAREYQAIISYAVYSQVLKGPEYMNIAGELEKHAQEELSHSLIVANQIDYLGGMPAVHPKEVKTSDKAQDMLRSGLENETESIRGYRDRVRQCEELGEYAMAEHIRKILMQKQEHQIDLATALGIDPPDSSGGS